uniref:Probable (S)-N-methylcoclaurine 3'-hydroxylase isozyme 2 n=2 Tax=Coptis japonica TaxID=3442 RepID=C80B2_COPJA|nr:RecName: Full=Probable (S)-N-methylcoclaurine 3'-hydroxylase isozyme 2; AltName: Full=Cytochrome P450 80B2 [Coptis japonica]BAB12433.1 (S)-N-methylcoclaurine-3'-hydroxylase [Coptis japonica]
MEVLSIAIVSFSFLLFLFFILRDSRPKNLPPGPRPSPIVGNLLQLGDKPHAEFAKLAQKYGELFSLKLGSQTVVVASSPAAAAEILKTHDKILSGRYVFQSFRVKEHVENSIVWSECNDNWKLLRKVCRTELFTPKMIESQSEIREAKAREMVKFLRGKEGEVVKIVEVVFGTLVNIFGNLIFSKDVFDLEDPTGGSVELKEHLWKLLDMGNSTNPADYFPIMGKLDLFGQRRAVAEVLQQIYDVWGVMLKERRGTKGSESKNDFVDVLLNAGLDDQKINALLMELFGAGTETSASTIEWAITELTKKPLVVSKIRLELVNVVGDNTVKESDLPHLPYLQAFVKETLRLHPPTPLLLPRRALETCTVMNYTIPKECQIMVNAWAIGRDPKTWDDPLNFKPERFLSSDVDYKGNDFELIPFGGGRRICPGLPLASQFSNLIVATLVQNFEWSLPQGMSTSELSMDEKFGLTLQKDPPLLIVLKARASNI